MQSELLSEREPWQNAYLYTWRAVLFSIPGMLLAFAFCGDGLIVVVAMGFFINHFLIRSGHTDRAFSVYFGLFLIILPLLVVLCAFPYFWLSLAHALLVLGCVISVTASSIAGIVAIPDLRPKNVDVLMSIEKVLFMVQPLVAVALASWFISSISGLQLTPYIMTGLGILVLQSQCPSPPSSFVAANTPLISKPVVEPSNMAVVLPLYIVLPLIATCVSSSAGVYTLLVEICFHLALGLMLLYFLGTETIAEITALSERRQRLGVGLCAAVVVVLLVPVLQSHGLVSSLFYWTPLTLTLIGIFVFSLQSVKRRLIARISGGLLLTVGAVVCYHLLQQLNLPVSMCVLLWLNAVCCILSAYTFSFGDRDQSSFVLLTETLLFVVLEWLGTEAYLFNSVRVISACLIWIYTLWRLLDAEKLTTSYWSVLSSCVLSCTLLVLQLMHVHDMPLLSTSSALLHFACLWPLVGCVLYAVITDLSSVKPSYFKLWLSGLAGVMLIEINVFLHSHLISLFIAPMHWPMLVVALPLLVVSGVCWKWSWCEASVTRHLQLISVLSLLTVVMLLLVAPGLDTRSDVCWWLAIACTPSGCGLWWLFVGQKFGSFWLWCACVLLSLPTALLIDFALYDSDVEERLMSCLATECAYCACLLAYLTVATTKLRHNDTLLMTTLQCHSVCSLLLLLADVTQVSPCITTDLSVSTGVLAVLTSAAVNMFTLKHVLTTRRREQLLTHTHLKASLSLPLCGNLSVMCTMVSFWVINPFDCWEITAIVSLPCLMCIQEDRLLVSKQRDSLSVISCAAVLPLLTSTAQHCAVLLLDNTSVAYVLKCVAEIFVLALTLPLWFSYIGLKLFSTDVNEISEVYTAFAYPLFSLLYLIGSSVSSYALATAGMAAGCWMLCYKLPSTSAAFAGGVF